MEKQLQSKIIELRDKEVVTIEMQQLCAKMEKQLVQQVRYDVATNSLKRIEIHYCIVEYKSSLAQVIMGIFKNMREVHIREGGDGA